MERDPLMPAIAMVVTVEVMEVTEVPMEVSVEVMEVTMVDMEDMDGECKLRLQYPSKCPQQVLVIICLEIQIQQVTKFN